MDIAAFTVAEDAHLESCDPEHVADRWRSGTGPFWIHVTQYQPDDLSVWLEQFHLTPFVTRRVLRIGQFTKVVATTDAFVVELRILGSGAAETPRQMILLCLDRLLISFDPTCASQVKDRVSHPTRVQLAKNSTTGILLSLLLMQLDRTSEEVHRERAAIFEMDGRMDRDPASVSLEEIHRMKDQLLALLAVAEEQCECYKLIAANESGPLDFNGLQGNRNLLLSGATSTERMASRLEKRVADLRQRYDAYQQEKTNRRLAVLTIISAVFLPLSLLAGIWGMNFSGMPELSLPFAYPTALMIMMLVAGGMVWFFRNRGWFD